MATFRYEAIDRSGALKTGNVEAATLRQAVDLAAGQGLYVRRVVPLHLAEAAGVEEALEVTAFEPLSEPAAENLAALLSETASAGLPLETALRAAAADAPWGERRVLSRIADDIAGGTTPAEAFVRAGDALPSHLVALILAGLDGGNLPRLLGRYLTLSRQRAETRRLLLVGLAYPVILGGAIGAVLLIAFLWIVPQFARILDDFGSRLPWITTAVIAVSKFLRTYWGFGLLAAAFGVAACGGYWLVTRRKGQNLFSLPAFDVFFRTADWGRFCGLLGLLVEGRQPLPHALRLTGTAAGTARVRNAGLALADDIERGLTPWEAAMPVRMPAAVRQAFRWAHRPEVFAEALAGLAELYSRRSRVLATLVGLFIEPLMLMIAASIVGGVILALFLPLFQLLNDLA